MMSTVVKLTDFTLLEIISSDLNLPSRDEFETQSLILTLRDLIRGTISKFKTSSDEVLALRKTRRGQVTKLANKLWDPIHATFSGDEGDQVKLILNVLSKMILNSVSQYTEPELREQGVLVMLSTSSIQKGKASTMVVDKLKEKLVKREFPIAPEHASRYRLTTDLVPLNGLQFRKEARVWIATEDSKEADAPTGPSKQYQAPRLHEWRDWPAEDKRVYGKLDCREAFHSIAISERLSQFMCF